jgi:imidazoleglycerol phosphate synthase glutamine amidotransferase subunit HisH
LHGLRWAYIIYYVEEVQMHENISGKLSPRLEKKTMILSMPHLGYLHLSIHFSKATTLDSNFTYAWLAFGHSFSMEKEHDQAMAAYCTAARLFPG